MVGPDISKALRSDAFFRFLKQRIVGLDHMGKFLGHIRSYRHRVSRCFMDGSTIATALQEAYTPRQLAGGRLYRSQLFSTIPPERIGLQGEFDYYGLSKRVSHCLRAEVEAARSLKVRQRGRVVVLSGQLGSPYQLRQVIDLAQSVHGVDEVETSGIAVAEVC